MKKFSEITKTWAPIIVLIQWSLLTACDITRFDDGTSALLPEENVIAGNIIGESVSEEQGGLLSSYQEAFAIPSPTGLRPGPSLLSYGNIDPVSGYTYSFNSTDGSHSVAFKREFPNSDGIMKLEYNLIYLFFDSNGNVIQDPANNMAQIDGVEFKSEKSGEIRSDNKESTFHRTDHLFIDGLQDASREIQIDGLHAANGNFRQLLDDMSWASRDYALNLEYLDIRINKQVVSENRNFREGVFGAFGYEFNIQQSTATDQVRSVNGSIVLNGDGTALLRFRDDTEPYHVQLDNGSVMKRNRFAGIVVHVDLTTRSFTLDTGERIFINQGTNVIRGKFFEFNELPSLLENRIAIRADGNMVVGSNDEDLLIATTVKFDLDTDAFDSIISAVHPVDQRIELKNGMRLYTERQSNIKFPPGARNLHALADMVISGAEFHIQGDFYVKKPEYRAYIRKADIQIRVSTHTATIYPKEVSDE